MIWWHKYRWKQTSAGLSAPLVVGATGGSGTRLFQQMMDAAGYYTGSDLNEPGDAMMLEPFVNEYINPILQRTGTLDYALEDVPGRSMKALIKALQRHIADKPADKARWGWKHPRSYYALPMLNALLPDMRFVHVVRDGRDIAFSSNQNPPTKHFTALFGEHYTQDCPRAAIRLWDKCNREVAAFGARELQDRYLRVNLEDMCAQPEAEIARLLAFAGVEDVQPDALLHLVQKPSSLGRWKHEDSALVAQLEALGRPALAQFGYLSTS